MRVTPEDPRYHSLAMGFNQRWVGHPSYIELVATPTECLRAVQRALDAGLRITVRAGGHCYEDFVADNDGGVIIDLSPMHRITHDDDGSFMVEAGCTNWNVYEELYRWYGVTIPGGSCYSVGLGGHICGGGYGLLSRTFGLTVDYLSTVEVVTVSQDGAVELVRAAPNDAATADLFWAHTGGGGGNFGVVTRYWFSDLPRPPDDVYLSTVAWPWSGLNESRSFGRLLANFGTFMAEHSDPDDEYRDLFALLKLGQLAAGEVVLVTQWGRSDRAPLDRFLAAMSAGVGPGGAQTRQLGHHGVQPGPSGPAQMPWLQACQTMNGSGPNQRGKYKSAYMLTPFPDEQVERIWAALNDPNYSNAQALVQVDSYGCQINARQPADTAVAQRSSIMKLQYQTYWTQAQDDQYHLDWIRQFYESVYASSGGEPMPNDVTDGCYVNYPDADLLRWPELYYKENYGRLQTTKRRWDPRNVFYHAQSVRP